MHENSILTVKEIAEKIFKFTIYNPVIAKKGKPGQFVIVRLAQGGERIPLTIVDTDPQAGTLTLIVQQVGKSTCLMCNLNAGDRIPDILGPLGNPSEIKNFGNVVVIGGGVGTAVSYPVAKALKAAGNHVTTIFGARTRDLVILENEMKAVSDACYITTDDGSYGFHGFVTTKLQALIDEGLHFDKAIAIGPLPMMRAVAELVRGGLVDRHRAGVGGRVRHLAGVERVGLRAVVAFFAHGSPVSVMWTVLCLNTQVKRSTLRQ